MGKQLAMSSFNTEGNGQEGKRLELRKLSVFVLCVLACHASNAKRQKTDKVFFNNGNISMQSCSKVI